MVTEICDANNPQAWHHCKINMFVGCFEISISAIIVNKHVQSIGIFRTFCLPGGTCYGFQCFGGQKNMLGCGLLGGFCTHADTMKLLPPHNSLIAIWNRVQMPHTSSGTQCYSEATIPS